MTSRERILSTFRGEEVDRFPVWLKMANDTWQSSQPEPYRSMGAAELLRQCGCDAMLRCGVRVKSEAPHVKGTVTQENGLRRTVTETPDGVLVGEQVLDPYTNSWHPTKFPADTPERLAALRWLFRDTTYHVDPTDAAKARERQQILVEQDVVTTAGIGPGPIMDLVENECGPENTFFMMHDVPELFDEVVALMHEARMRHLRALMPHMPTDTFWLTENTSTSLISPTIFRQYCMPHLTAYGRLIQEHGIIAVHHMCGTLNALLEMIDELPAEVNEAYTTRPLGDVSLAEGRRRMPSKALIGGTNATLWLSAPENILATVAADLAACPDRRKIFLTSAGVLPPVVNFEKARTVVEGLKRL